MNLRVKPGKRYKSYREGEIVENVHPKYHRVLTLPKGPLEFVEGDEPNTVAADLPDEAMPVAEVVAEDDLGSLREEYETAVGKRPFMGWDADTLRAKMAEYRRKDMRAGE